MYHSSSIKSWCVTKLNNFTRRNVRKCSHDKTPPLIARKLLDKLTRSKGHPWLAARHGKSGVVSDNVSESRWVTKPDRTGPPREARCDRTENNRSIIRANNRSVCLIAHSIFSQRLRFALKHALERSQARKKSRWKIVWPVVAVSRLIGCVPLNYFQINSWFLGGQTDPSYYSHYYFLIEFLSFLSMQLIQLVSTGSVAFEAHSYFSAFDVHRNAAS